jgi:hypothetical protein
MEIYWHDANPRHRAERTVDRKSKPHLQKALDALAPILTDWNILNVVRFWNFYLIKLKRVKNESDSQIYAAKRSSLTKWRGGRVK